MLPSMTPDRHDAASGDRQAQVEVATAHAALRVAGSALLVAGTLGQQMSQQAGAEATFVGPCLLPARPALYTCLSKVRVSMTSQSCSFPRPAPTWTVAIASTYP